MSIFNEYKMQNTNKNIFNDVNSDWWDPSGSFKALHSINPCRIEYIIKTLYRNKLIEHNLNSKHKILKGLDIIDIGCGGGLLCEPLARLGGNVLGIDNAPNAIKVAKNHAKKMNLKIQYQCTKIEDLSNAKFDLIIASEIIEHIENRKSFLDNITKISNSKSSIVITTINKSLPGIILAKYIAEYFLKLIPVGTHDWEKFISPETLQVEAEKSGIILDDFTGIMPNPITKDFFLGPILAVNYAASGMIK